MNTAELSSMSKQVRRDIINMTANAGSGHPGGSLSAADLMTCLFFNHMHVDPKHPDDPDRDRFVLSKGHAAPCYYAVLAEMGFIFVVRNCVQGIGRSRFVLGAGAAELVARIAVCLTLPAAVAGGVVSAQANPLAFYALCAADPMAWIAADIVLAIPFFRNILRRDYRYMNI